MPTRGLASRLSAAEQTTLTLVVDDDPTNGVAVGTGGSEGIAFMITIGAGGSQGTFSLELQEGSTAITGPWTDIAVADLEFPTDTTNISTNPELLLASGDAGTYFIGYKGNATWVHIEITTTATTPDFGIATAVVTGWERRIGNTP